MVKKKIKDFTVGEAVKICNKHFTRCTICPFTGHCPFSPSTNENDLETEVEYPHD